LYESANFREIEISMNRLAYFSSPLFKFSKHLCTILCLASVCLSIVSLHFSEAIENDGLTLCKTIDSGAKSCKSTQQDDNDNDNETVKVLGELDTLKKFQLSVPLPSPLEIPDPEYKNSYFFAYLFDLNRPPTFII